MTDTEKRSLLVAYLKETEKTALRDTVKSLRSLAENLERDLNYIEKQDKVVRASDRDAIIDITKKFFKELFEVTRYMLPNSHKPGQEHVATQGQMMLDLLNRADRERGRTPTTPSLDQLMK